MIKFLLTIPILLLFFILPTTTYAQIYTTEKMIVVNTGNQTLTAWENGKVFHETKVSTGMKLTPTVKGSYKIYNKIALHDMRGPSPYKNIYPSGKYHIKNVPHAMYFYQGYAIHGAYWHNNFGRVASHGCVNVPLKSAELLYNWASKSTRVEVF